MQPIPNTKSQLPSPQVVDLSAEFDILDVVEASMLYEEAYLHLLLDASTVFLRTPPPEVSFVGP